MFNIHSRHSPMFNTSDFKTITDSLSEFLKIQQVIETKKSELEFIPLHQTVRINEVNSLILKQNSEQNNEEITESIQSDIKKNFENLVQYSAENYLGYLTENFSIGPISYASPSKDKTSVSASHGGAKSPPVLVFNSKDSLENHQIEEISGIDYFAIWEDKSHLEKNLKDNDAFFSITPSIKLETSLNRFIDVSNLGSFCVGMVRF